MNDDLLKRLSNADAVAAREGEVRNLLYDVCRQWCDRIECDNLGSILFFKNSKQKDPLKIMFTAHMDEVGFLVRHISDIGMLELIKVGGVRDYCLDMQKVRVTTKSKKKIFGVMNLTKNEDGSIKTIYVDIGADSCEEVLEMGVEIGDMVTFSTQSNEINRGNIVAGKAMDDRTGCYVLAQCLKELCSAQCEAEVIFAGTSSEEVGMRGGKTAVVHADPDIVFAIDVANHPELDRGYTNHRKIGHGIMLEQYDKSMSPNEKLLQFVQKVAEDEGLPYQLDMFSGGGTDAGNAHLVGNGKLAMVIGIPLRYCHGPISYVHKNDLKACIQMVCALSKRLTKKEYRKLISFMEDRK